MKKEKKIFLLKLTLKTTNTKTKNKKNNEPFAISIKDFIFGQLTNRENESCYANSLIIAISNCKDIRLNLEKKHAKDIQKVVKSLKECLDNLLNIEFSNTNLLRINVDKQYAPGTGPKSIINFYEDLLKRIPSMKLLFNYFTVKTLCSLCEFVKNKQIFFVNYLSISIDITNNNQFDLNQSLNNSLCEKVSSEKCNKCKEFSLYKRYQFTKNETQKYLSLKINQNKIINMTMNFNSIFQFDAIPNHQFRIIGIIKYKNINNSGHFIGITRF